jgi:hypothetical protein
MPTWPKFPGAPRPPQPPKAPAGFGRKNAPGNVTKQPIRKFGPRYLKLFSLPGATEDWCVPWPTFVGAHTSLSEQMIYRAIAKVKNDPQRPEQPPYVGGVTWEYQAPDSAHGGRLSKGGTVCDFLVEWGSEDVCLRLQSEH